MQKIFEGEIFEVLPLSNGIIFSYCKDTTEDNIIVAYKMITFDNGRFTDVAKNIYLISKFGNSYKAVVEQCDNYITVKSILLPNGKVFLMQTDGVAKLLDTDATPIWTGSLVYRSCNPSDIILHNNALWVSYADCNVLVRFNLSTMREELRIGGAKSPFVKPRDLFLEGDSAIVSNHGSHKRVKINLREYTVSDCEEFEEPLYQYIEVAGNRFVVLESGLYLL